MLNFLIGFPVIRPPDESLPFHGVKER